MTSSHARHHTTTITSSHARPHTTTITPLHVLLLLLMTSYATSFPDLPQPVPQPDLATLGQAVDACWRVLIYYQHHVTEMNLDAVIGTRIAEGQFALVVSALESRGGHDVASLATLDALHGLLNLTTSLNAVAEPLIMVTQPQYYRELGDIISRGLWEVPLATLFLDETSTTSHHDPNAVLKGTEQLEESQSDYCVTEAIGKLCHVEPRDKRSVGPSKTSFRRARREVAEEKDVGPDEIRFRRARREVGVVGAENMEKRRLGLEEPTFRRARRGVGVRGGVEKRVGPQEPPFRRAKRGSIRPMDAGFRRIQSGGVGVSERVRWILPGRVRENGFRLRVVGARRRRDGRVGRRRQAVGEGSEAMRQEYEEVRQKELEGFGRRECVPCDITRHCWESMTQPGYSSYSLTHQVFYLVIAMQSGCGPEVAAMARAAPGGGDGTVGGLLRRVCSEVLQEAKVIATEDFPQQFRDLFMEQGALCGLVGYRDFFRREWLARVLSWQKDSGCFGDPAEWESRTTAPTPDYNPDSNPHVRVRREEKVMSEDCLAHMSAVAVGYLSIYVRFLVSSLFL